MDDRNYPVTRLDAASPLLLIIGAVISALGFVLAFTVAPLVHGASVTPELVGDELVANQLLFSQKIFYFHVPLAIASFIALVFTAFYGIRFLMTRNADYDTKAKTSTEVSLVFIMCTMAMGVPWTRFEWGVWWSWEPRLTTYLILMLLVIAYFVLRAAIADTDRKAVFASVFGIIVFLDAPLCFAITRIIPNSTHPVVFRTDSGLPPDMLIPFLICMLGILIVAFALYRLRLSQVRTAAEIEAIKLSFEQERGGLS